MIFIVFFGDGLFGLEPDPDPPSKMEFLLPLARSIQTFRALHQSEAIDLFSSEVEEEKYSRCIDFTLAFPFKSITFFVTSALSMINKICKEIK